MSDFVAIRPKDDAASRQASDWCSELIRCFVAGGHSIVVDVSDRTPADKSNIVSAMRQTCQLICYFGHGDGDAWLTGNAVTVDAGNVKAARGRAILSIACKTGKNLGPDAVTAGVICWLGFTIKVPVVPTYKTRDPFGEAIVDALSGLGNGRSMQQVRDDLQANLVQLVTDFDSGGCFEHHPSQLIGYFSAMALSNHVVVHGDASHRPL